MNMVNGTAPRPFVHRALVPTLVRLGAGALPAGWKQAIDAGIARHVSPRIRQQKWPGGHECEFALALALVVLSLLGFMLALRRLIREFYRASPWVSGLLPVVAVWLLPVFFSAGTHFVYDFPALFLFTLLLLFMWRRSWCWFYPVYVLALLNKETAVFVTLVFAFHFRSRLPRREFHAHLFSMFGLFFLIKSGLSLAFAGNPGPLLEWHLRDNLFALITPFSLGAASDFALVLLLTFHDFRQKPRFLRDALVIAVPLLALQVPFGVWGEIRVYYEVYPALFLLMAHSALGFVGLARAPEGRGDPRTTAPGSAAGKGPAPG